MKSNYEIVSSNETELEIRDLGPWDEFATVTNNAEAVVAELHANGWLGTRRLFYADSEGDYAEIIHKAGRFVRFEPVWKHTF